MTGDASGFFALRPQRLEPGLPLDYRNYHTFFSKNEGRFQWWFNYSRSYPDSSPWDSEGWYIPIPSGMSHDEYKLLKPVKGGCSGGVCWCFNDGKWTINTGENAEWIIPYMLNSASIEMAKVIHDW